VAGDRPALTQEQEGRALVERLGGRWTANGGMCRCPAHEDHTPSLSVRPGLTRLLFHCFAGCHASDVLRALELARLIAPCAATAGEPVRHKLDDRLNAAAHRIWSEARPIRGTPAERYLAGRAVQTDSPQLRYHPRAPHGPKPSTQFRPALIAAIRDEAGLTGIHRTFIDPQPGKLAARVHARCGLGRFGRGAVRLGGVAPRIETALSATALFGVPCWATLGTERLSLVAIPSEVEELLLFLDHDGGGRRAERLARDAFAHVAHIEAHYPEQPGDDWNDVLRASLRVRHRT
jgi:putative DNA primase/helicase